MHSIKDALEATQSALRSAVMLASGDIKLALDNFEAQTGIRGKSDGSLVILDYDTMNVKWTQPFGYVCRGLILDPLDNWAVVAFGLNKFFNHGEGPAAVIDWSSAVCFEKLDGSMVQRYWNPYTGQFEFSTRFQLHQNMATNKVSSLSNMTWLQMVEAAFGTWAVQQPKNETWVFEVQTPLNKIVVQHKTFKVNLIAIRNIDTLCERSVHGQTNAAFSTNFMRTAEEAKSVADTYAGTEQEGFVVCDANFNRVKIKNVQYVALHRLKDGINSVGAVINLAKSGDYEEVVVNFPEYKRALDMAIATIGDLVLEHEQAYEDLKCLPTQKEFALAVQARGLRCSSALFLTRAGKATDVKRAIMDQREAAFVDCVKSKLGPEFIQFCMLPATA